jgi:hypothetical protein
MLVQKVFPWQKPVSVAAKPLGSELLISRLVFLAQGGVRQKLKMSFLNMSLKIMYIVCIPNSHGKHPATPFVEPEGKGMLRAIHESTCNSL